MSRLKKYLLFLLFPFIARANDCVPLTFEKLSEYIHEPVSYHIWYHALLPDDNPPTIPDSINVWDTLFPKNKLLCIYVSPVLKKDNIIVYDAPIVAKRIYVWVGLPPDEYRADKNEKANVHMAFVFFEKDKITIITPTKPNNIDSSAMIVMQPTFDEFWGETFLVFEVVNNPRD